MTRNFDRRQILIGAAAGVATPYLVGFGETPVVAQDGVRVRREVHGLVNEDGTLHPDLFIYMEAIAKTKTDSPVLWEILTNFHDVFCSGAGSNEVHRNWRFIMWHRAYLATYERILQEHSDKPVSLPYWNWFKSDSLPSAFTQGVLNHSGRVLGDEDGPRPIDDADRGAVEADNYDASVAFEFGILTSFFGQAFDAAAINAGVPEGNAHGGMHNWVGGEMANLNTASRDPCFYSHHANVDRMMELWKVNRAPDNWDTNAPSTWKNQIFEFAFDTDRVYRYRASDMINTSKIVDVDGVKLGFVYDDVPKSEPEEPSGPLIAFAPPASDTVTASKIEMRVKPPSQSFLLGGMEVKGGTGTTATFELSDDARAVTDQFLAKPEDGGANILGGFSFNRTSPPSARLVLRDVVLPGKNSQVNFFINVENPGIDSIKKGGRYLGTINTIPSGEGQIVYPELNLKASDEIIKVIRSENQIYITSFTRYLGTEDAVKIGSVELVIE